MKLTAEQKADRKAERKARKAEEDALLTIQANKLAERIRTRPPADVSLRRAINWGGVCRAPGTGQVFRCQGR